jgi:hypothetical protein
VALSALAFMADLWTRSSGPLSSLPDPSISRSVAYLGAVLAMVLLGAVLVLHGRRHSRG